ncbi:class I SAM-dependent methyltransferase [Methylobacterium nigriterrae]|uniref:class I SAM-dependent methyltransferase n=1 Tax=Methylobacterium nigriterrae TaxID=3127512 RepID=UPI0030139A28
MNHAVAEEVASTTWFHRIDLGGGLVTPGIDDTPFKLTKIHLPADLAGQSVIDIGAWNGAFSFACERRGAARVLATDWYCWQGAGKRGFDIAKRALGSHVEEREVKVEEISAASLGTFDLVLFLGVLYHAPDPIGYLRRVREVCAGMAIIETLVDAEDYPRPALVFYEGDTENRDATNFFGPNRLACEAMLREVGFREVRKMDEFYGNRMVFHAFV